MSQWKTGDIVTFTETGTIAHIADGIATIDVRGIPHTMHVSHILGTPEQAKRERIMATLRQDFGSFHFHLEPLPGDNGFMVVFEDVLSKDIHQYWLNAIEKRIAELQESNT